MIKVIYNDTYTNIDDCNCCEENILANVRSRTAVVENWNTIAFLLGYSINQTGNGLQPQKKLRS